MIATVPLVRRPAADTPRSAAPHLCLEVVRLRLAIRAHLFRLSLVEECVQAPDAEARLSEARELLEAAL